LPANLVTGITCRCGCARPNAGLPGGIARVVAGHAGWHGAGGEADKRAPRIAQISWGRMEVEDLARGRASATPSTTSASTEVRTDLARLGLQMMIKLKILKPKWRVILTCLAVVVGITVLTEPTWKGSSVPTSSSKPAITASGAVHSELEALLNDGAPNSATPAVTSQTALLWWR